MRRADRTVFVATDKNALEGNEEERDEETCRISHDRLFIDQLN